MLGLLIGQTTFLARFLQSEKEAHESKERKWEHERERLVNRAMTNTWQDYTQMTGALQPATPPVGDEYFSMSDEQEAHAASVAGMESFGEEVLIDFNDEFHLG